MENISADEIKRQATALNNKVDYLRKNRTSVALCLENLSKCVKSEDSNLEKNLFNLANLFSIAYEMADKAFTGVADIMTNYANTSIQNEESLASDVKSAQSAVEQINSEVPEVFVDFN